MADFSQGSSIDTPTAAPAVPSQAPDGDATGVAIGVGAVAGIASIFASSRSTQTGPTFAQKQKIAENKVVGDHLNKLSAIADAVQEGAMSSREGATRSRELLRGTMGANDQFSAQIQTAHNSFAGKSGAGGIISTGTKKEQDNNKLLEKAYSVGAVDPNDSQEQQDASLEVYKQDIRRVEDINQQSKILAFSEAKLKAIRDKDSHEYQMANNLVAKTRQDLEANVNSTFSGALSRNQTIYRTIASDSSLSSSDKVVKIEEQFNAFMLDIEIQGSGLESDTIKGYVSRATRFKDIYLQVASGELDSTTSSNLLRAQNNGEILAFTADPKTAAIVALSAISPIFALQVAPDIAKASADYFATFTPNRKEGTVGTAEANTPDQVEAFKTFSKSWMEPWMKADNKGMTNEEQANETRGTVENILKGITPGTGAEVNPARYQPVLSFLANPVSREYLSNQGEMMDLRLQAGTVLQQEFSDGLLPAIRNEMDFAAGDRVTMEQGVVRVTSLNPRRQRQLQKNVEGHINTYVRGMSHLGGLEYPEFWDQAKPVLFPGQTTLDAAISEADMAQELPGF